MNNYIDVTKDNKITYSNTTGRRCELTTSIKLIGKVGKKKFTINKILKKEKL